MDPGALDVVLGLLPEGTAAALVIVTVVLFQKSQKSRDEAFVKALDAQRASFEKALDAQQSSFERSLERVEQNNIRNVEQVRAGLDRVEKELSVRRTP